MKYRSKHAAMLLIISALAFTACGNSGSGTGDTGTPSSKAITTFTFASPAATGMIYETSHLIVVTVPYGTDATSLAPAITISGASISPASELARDFTDDVIYTVTAQDGSTQNYTATVNVADEAAGDITAFSFSAAKNALAYDCIGIISNPTIVVKVPYGTDVTNLTPTITISGASISPLPGVSRDFTSPVTYTVKAANYSSIPANYKDYTVKVIAVSASEKTIDSFTFANPAATGIIDQTDHTIAVNVPYGTAVDKLYPAINFTGKSLSPASGVAQDFRHPVTYTVTAQDGSTQNYTVTVSIASSSAKAITAFYFTNNPWAIGTINEINHTIYVNIPDMPYTTDLNALVPTITITGAGVSPASGIPNSFYTYDYPGHPTPVLYTVTAADGSTQGYTIKVTQYLDGGNVYAGDKAIKAFAFADPSVEGAINEYNHTINVNVKSGTDVTKLVPLITHSGASINPVSGLAKDFSAPGTYSVTAADYSTQNYTVTVNVSSPDAKTIKSFDIPSLSAAGIVNETSNIIFINVPHGTDILNTNFTPVIIHTGASIDPDSGIPQNFYSFAGYTVTAADGSQHLYAVRMREMPTNADKAITAFEFAKAGTAGIIDEANHTIAVTVHKGTDITNLVPSLSHTGLSISPAAGVSQNFTSPRTYTVTAADGSTQAYMVTVTVSPDTNYWELAGNSIVSNSFPVLSPQLVCNNTDAYITYRQGSYSSGYTWINFYVKHFNGTDWEPFGGTVEAESEGPATLDDFPVIALDAGGKPFVYSKVYGDLYLSRWNGTAWNMDKHAVPIGSGTVMDYKMAITNDGTSYVAQMEQFHYNEIFVARAQNGAIPAGVVGGRINLDLANGGVSPDIATDGTQLYVSWIEGVDGGTLYVKKFNGTDWDLVGTSLNTPSHGVVTQRIISLGTTPYVAFQERDGVNTYRICVKHFNGSAWVQDGSSFAGGEEYVTSLGIASDGSTPYVAYTALNAGHLNVYEKHFNGADWVQDGGSLNVDTTRDSMNVSIGCLGAVPYVTWLERDSSGGASDTTYIFTKRWR